MRDYETMVVIVPNLPEDENAKIIDRIKEIIDSEGEITNIEEWGLKPLAYKIANQYTEGYYVLFNFKGNKEILDNLEHYYRITDQVIRYIIVKDDSKKD